MKTLNLTPWTVYVYHWKSAAIYEELTLAFSTLKEATYYADTISEYGLFYEIVKEP